MTDTAQPTSFPLFDAMQDAAITVAYTLSVAGDIDLPAEVRQALDRYRRTQREWADAIHDDAVVNGIDGTSAR